MTQTIALPKLPSPIPFVQARNYTRVDPSAPRSVSLLVIHTMEYPDNAGAAKWCAEFFAGSDSPIASAHYAVDNSEVYHMVQECDVAYGAPGANRNGIHIEHAGRAAETPADWASSYNLEMLKLSAVLAAQVCYRHKIPIRKLTVEQVAQGLRGICGHVDVTRAFPERHGTHTDPGSDFPWSQYIAWVNQALLSDKMRPITPSLPICPGCGCLKNWDYEGLCLCCTFL